jgi:sulfite reductase (NADPH) flavoprotein alpha-component
VANSSASFVLDTWPTYDSFPQSEGVYKIEAREGVGAAIQGFATAAQLAGSAKPVSVLATADSLRLLAPTLATLSNQGAAVVVSVAANPTNTAELFAALNLLTISAPGFKGEVLFSGGQGARQVLDTTATAYSKAGKTVIHVFDDLEAAQEQILFDTPSAQAIDAFTYTGAASPEVVLLLPSSMNSSIAVAALTAMESPAADKVAILTVNEINEASFNEGIKAHLPASVQAVHAPTADIDIGQTENWFYDVALAAVTSSGSTASVIPLPVVSSWTVREWASTLVRIASPSSSKAFATPALKSLLPASSKLASFWTADNDASSKVAPALANRFAQLAHEVGGGVIPRLLEHFDNFAGGKSAKGFGVKNAELLLSPTDQPVEYNAPLSALSLVSEPSFIFVSDPQFVLASYNAIERAGAETQIVFASKWAPEEYKEKLGKHEKNKLTGHDNVWTINTDAIAKEVGLTGEDGVALVEQVVFWIQYLQGNEAPLAKIVGADEQYDISKIIAAVKAGLQRVDLPSSDMEVDAEEKAVPMHNLAPGEGDHSAMNQPAYIKASQAAYGPNSIKSNDEPLPSHHKSIQLVAQQYLYPEAYALPSDETEKMRPDLTEENFIITVSENRRLTPSDYDRNVFHMEFDTAGTGLKYAVGEALGIHGLNDEQEVREFIDYYGFDPEALITFPSRTDPSGKIEVRTVFQLFQQTLDLFGKPPKSFYEVLSKYATSKEEARHLRFISVAEGSATFKKMSEMETVTYADVLRAFPSTKETFRLEQMVAEIAFVKPRHYSIASSQNAVGDSVHLLIVTVDWETSSGQKRFGQCTRYLAGLPVGAKVMVSIKPSVMKVSIQHVLVFTSRV